jgi:predicted aldo/keto reductase-like oxidoreductase
MDNNSSRRNFIAAGLALPVAGLASASLPSIPAPAAPFAAQQGSALSYRTIGKTGLKVTSVGFGCMITSDQSVVEKGLDLGITYFDTARSYQSGNNERMVGAALKSKRKSITLATKTGGATKQAALDHLDTSLKELQTDYVDIWHLHGKSNISQVTDDLIDAQQTAKKAGKIRFAGVSTHSNQATLIPAIVQKGMHDVILVAYNYAMAQDLTDAINAARKAGVGIVGMKVMAGGARGSGGRGAAAQPAAPKPPGAVLAALKWVLSNPSVDTTVPSMTDMDQLEENLKAMAQPLSDSDKKLLTAHLEFMGPLYCRGCGKCEGTCAKGLPVAEVLRYVMYAEDYGQFALGREHFKQLPAHLAAVRCGECPSCTVNCPNGVRVTQRLSRAQEVFA